MVVWLASTSAPLMAPFFSDGPSFQLFLCSSLQDLLLYARIWLCFGWIQLLLVSCRRTVQGSPLYVAACYGICLLHAERLGVAVVGGDVAIVLWVSGLGGGLHRVFCIFCFCVRIVICSYNFVCFCVSDRRFGGNGCVFFCGGSVL